jgi:D-alanyl-D-alanine carboxypeptidase
MKRIKVISICLLMLFCSTAKSQTTASQLDSIFNHTLDSLRTLINIKSVSAAVQLPDTSVWAGASGISSVNPPVDVTTSDVFLIGSVTKTITAACVLQLVEQNILNLDDSLYMWLDTIQYINPHITIRQLLRHQSGLYDVLTAPGCQPAMLADPDSIWATQDIITTFIQIPNFPAGTSWGYCNTNYLLLSMVIEEATGNPFYIEFQNRFFSTLGLTSPAAFPFEPLNSPVAHLWLDLTGDGVTDDANNWLMSNEALNASGGAAGCYFATPSDITRWMRSYMRGDVIDPSIMSQAFVVVPAFSGQGASYGLGLMEKYFLGFYQGLGHGGDFGYAASSWYFPLRDISITVSTNDSEHNSWGLIPVVTALLKSYNQWLTLTGADEINNEVKLSVYPNPFTDKITVDINSRQLPGTLTILLYDAFGKELLSMEKQVASNNEPIQLQDIEKLPAGIYFIAVISENKFTKTIKIVK